jgi:Ni/Fe-hydrogenase subunit HybB-like protein
MVFGYSIVIAPNYILSKIELEAKRYGLKNSITNLMNQLSYTLDPTIVLDYTNRGRDLLLLVSQ